MALNSKEKYKDYDLVIKKSKQFDKIPKNFLGKIIIDCKEDDPIEIDNMIKSEITITGKTNCIKIYKSKIYKINENVKIESIESSDINSISGDINIDYISDCIINQITENVNILQINGNTKIDYICDIKINKICDNVYIENICGSNLYIQNIYDDAILAKVFGNVKIKNVFDNAIIKIIDPKIKIKNIFGNATIIYNYLKQLNIINEKDFIFNNGNKLKIENNLELNDYQIKRFLILNDLKVNSENKIIVYKDFEKYNFKNDYNKIITNHEFSHEFSLKQKLFSGGGIKCYPNSNLTIHYSTFKKFYVIKCEVDLKDVIVVRFNNITTIYCKKIVLKDVEYKN